MVVVFWASMLHLAWAWVGHYLWGDDRGGESIDAARRRFWRAHRRD
jgi:hypothetical protein